MWNREMVQRKKRLRICNRGGCLVSPFLPDQMEGFKMLSGKQPVQFEVGTDENGRALAMNILPLSVEEEA